MNTKYENFKKLEKYIEALKGEYCQKYSEFTFEQIRRPIYLVAEWVSLDAKEPSSEKLRMFAIDSYKKILKDRERVDQAGLYDSMLGVLHFLNKREEFVRQDTAELADIPFPEKDKERYLEFISKMTDWVVRDMCNALEKKISYVGKIEYFEWTKEKPCCKELERIKALDAKNVFGKAKKRYFAERQQLFSERLKSKRVSFVNEVKKSK